MFRERDLPACEPLISSPGRNSSAKLEEAGYVAVEKKFVQRKPQTLYRMTEAGRQAPAKHVQALKQLLGASIDT